MEFASLMAACTVIGLFFAVVGLSACTFEYSITKHAPKLSAIVDNALVWIIAGGVGAPLTGYGVACVLKPFGVIVGI